MTFKSIFLIVLLFTTLNTLFWFSWNVSVSRPNHPTIYVPFMALLSFKCGTLKPTLTVKI